jgi:hypothetical protein
VPVASNWIVPPVPDKVTVPDWPLGAAPFISAAVSWMDFNLLVAPQPSMVNASSAQVNAAKRVLRFTAEYLQKESSASSQHPSHQAR